MIEENLYNLARILRSKYFRARFSTSQDKLRRAKKNQRDRFDKLKGSFSDKYAKLENYNIDKFTTPLWKKFNNSVKKSLLPVPPFNFLNDSTIMLSMFATAGGRWLKKEISSLENKIDKKKLKDILQEDYVGDPLLLNSYYLTSHTVVHHLHHFVEFLDKTKTKIDDLNTIVEWGGGYGSLIRILKRFNSKKRTYIIIDTPLFSCLQWIYLATIFGEKEVNFILSSKDKIKENKINILPVSFLNDIKFKADLFISTWALSESSKYSQDFVLKKNWFGAKRILLAYQDNPAGLFNPSRVGKLARDKGAIIEDIEFLPGNHYAFL